MKQCQLKLATLRALVIRVLEKPAELDWSIQGLGMMRLYLGDVGRIHIWDATLRTENVSEIHTHSWDLRSIILSGRIYNTRFLELTSRRREVFGESMWRQHIHCGMEGGKKGDPEPVVLQARARELYLPGESYAQRADEIHWTDTPGAVTLIERDHDGPDGEADVYWPASRGAQWVDAKPRMATREEVLAVTSRALARIYSEVL